MLGGGVGGEVKLFKDSCAMIVNSLVTTAIPQSLIALWAIPVYSTHKCDSDVQTKPARTAATGILYF